MNVGKHHCVPVYVDDTIYSYRFYDESADTSNTMYVMYHTPTGVSHITCSRVSLVKAMNDPYPIPTNTGGNFCMLEV